MKDIKYVLPVISPNHEQVTVVSKNELHITKPDGKLVVKCNVPMHLTETKKGRIFNFVPGMEALPVEVQNDNFEIEILVHWFMCPSWSFKNFLKLINIDQQKYLVSFHEVLSVCSESSPARLAKFENQEFILINNWISNGA